MSPPAVSLPFRRCRPGSLAANHEGGAVATTARLRVDIERLKADVLALGEIGRDPDDRGIYRMAFTEADMLGRHWLMDRAAATGLAVAMDGAGNVHARLGAADGSAVVIGSHTDTVPRAGMLDGALGVLCGLECLRVLAGAGITPATAIELISFSDEEGRFGGMLGSEALCGFLTPESLHLVGQDGVPLADEMRARGLDPMGLLDARRPARDINAYFELHIEQGPLLSRAGVPVGVVDRITGLFKWAVRLRGEANHAGTTPMDMRHDAFLGLAEFANGVEGLLARAGGPRSRATIGRAEILPGAANTVPGEVLFSLDVRDTDPATLDALALAAREELAAIARRRGLMLDLEVQSEIAPEACDPDLVALVAAAAGEAGAPSLVMPSGAAHDAQIVARIAPVAMIFVPSRDGQSHAPSEWTDWGDIEMGANVLLGAVARRARVAA